MKTQVRVKGLAPVQKVSGSGRAVCCTVARQFGMQVERHRAAGKKRVTLT